MEMLLMALLATIVLVGAAAVLEAYNGGEEPLERREPSG